jgi:hypothetical protein
LALIVFVSQPNVREERERERERERANELWVKGPIHHPPHPFYRGGLEVDV